MCLGRNAFDTECSVYRCVSHEHEMTPTHEWRNRQHVDSTVDMEYRSRQFIRRHNVLYARQQPSGSNAHASESSPRYCGEIEASRSTPDSHSISSHRERCSYSVGQRSRYWYRRSYCRGSLAPLFTQFSLRCSPCSPLMSVFEWHNTVSGLPLWHDATDGKWGDPEHVRPYSMNPKITTTSRTKATERITTALRQSTNPQGQFTCGRYQPHPSTRQSRS